MSSKNTTVGSPPPLVAPAAERFGAAFRPRPKDDFRMLALLVTRPPELARAIQIPIL
jgi:hypothetical protein